MHNLDQRTKVVEEARTWLGTPYHHRASIRGVGVDCALLLLEAFAGAGVIERFDVGHYTCDWHLHRGEEKYLNQLSRHLNFIAAEGDPSLKERGLEFSLPPATVLMWRVGRTFSHSALVTEWPYVIHAYLPSQVVEEVDVRRTPMALRPLKVFSHWDEVL